MDFVSLRKRLSVHIAKLNAGQSTTQIQLSPEAVAAWTAAIEQNDAEALRELRRERSALIAEVRLQDPRLLHQRRLSAQYVDLGENGSWSLPSQTDRSETQALILIVACELSDFLYAEPDDAFAAAFNQSGEVFPKDAEYQERVISRVMNG